jgi:hypothetical protein
VDGQLDNTDLSGFPSSADAEAMALEKAIVIGVDAIVTVVVLDYLGCPIELDGAGPRR